MRGGRGRGKRKRKEKEEERELRSNGRSVFWFCGGKQLYFSFYQSETHSCNLFIKYIV